MSKKLFVTGTGTDIGKTYISGLLVKKMRENQHSVAYYKAAMSGNVRDEEGTLIPGDAMEVKELSGISQAIESMCPYVFEMAVSPHLAARLENCPIDLQKVKQQFYQLSEQYDYLLMEGSGGITCPITYDNGKVYLWELVKELDLPSVIVADAGLGTINDVVLTCFFMKQHGLKVKGLIFNHVHPGDVMEEDNIKMCREITGCPVLALVSEGDSDLNIDEESLETLF
ncbi:MAG: dethiobiotin synthase [Lachnospiraceae bacterium]|nr:dethiobiotin synthase [Lachnospiraceae bacterium]